MELVVMFGIVFFFGAVALSMVAQRNSPPQAPILVVRAESLDKAASSDTGFSFVVLLFVIAAALWLF